MRKTHLGACAVTLLVVAAAGTDEPPSTFESFLHDFTLLPEYYLQTDIKTFLLHKNDYFRRQYLAEANLGLEFMLLSFRDLVYSTWDFDFDVGIGEVPGNIVFTVLDIMFSITPQIEVRLPHVDIATGLQHYCVHEVDRKDLSIVYWNNLYLAAGSKNRRINEFWSPLAADTGWTLRNRISWHARWGFFLKEFFGLVAPTKLDGMNPRTTDVRISSRFAFYRRRSWIVAVRACTMVGHYAEVTGLTDRSGIYWRQDLGIQSFFRRGRRGGALYVNFVLDHLPAVAGVSRFSKDRLLEIGVSFFN
jgi:hypothetical protein